MEDNEYLMVVDYLSKSSVVKEFSVTTLKDVIHASRQVLTDFCTPKIIVSDNCPQFSHREFQDFCVRKSAERVIVTVTR